MMLGYTKFPALLLLLSAFWLGLGNALPSPERREELLIVRQNNGSFQPITVQTQDTLQTPSGPMLQSCQINLTPVTGPNGEALVQEMKTCSLQSIDTTNGNSSAGASSAATSSPTSSGASSAAATSSASASATLSGVVQNGVSTIPLSAVTGLPSSSASPSASALTSSAPVSSSTSQSGSSSASASASSASVTSTSGASPTPGANAAGNPNSSASSSSANPSGTSAADSATSSTPAFQIPGKQLSVLPIGLAVFAGISVIALIVVGLVTYERTKYRRAFRQRKLAESGASMGYGGMAQAA